MNIKQAPELTVADIFEKYLPAYLQTYPVTEQQLKVINDILRCQTPRCGMHARVCVDCGVIDYSYNSCRNRHCPTCQNAQKQAWMQKRKKELLPVSYFHLVFTLPHQLNSIFIANKQVCYGMLFEIVWKTIAHFSTNPRWLGAQTGCTALLHTWGQNMSFHPHIHCIMPAGGLTQDGFEWLHTHPRFFAPVRELSKKFRTEFVKALSAQASHLELSICQAEWDTLMAKLENINWVVFAQPSFTSPQYVIDYLGNYTHKIAISNYRLIKMENDQVFFYWKDYKDKGKQKIIHLPVMEFIRRFLEHVLPHNFYKIRHFGIFSNRFKASNIEKARKCLEREGKTLNITDQTNKFAFELPPSCPYMGICKECGGATISLYHYEIYVINNEKLLKTG